MSDPQDSHAYHRLYSLVRAIARHAEKIEITTVWFQGGATFTINAHPEDVGELLCEQDKLAESIRPVVTGIGSPAGRQFNIVINPCVVAEAARPSAQAVPA